MLRLPRDVVKRIHDLHYFYHKTILSSQVPLTYRLWWKYACHVLDKLSYVIKESVSLEIKLEALLAENWQLINGTMFCYTVEADDDITRLLCTIATWVAAEKNRQRTDASTPLVGAIQLLMPTISLEPYFDSFPLLKPQEKNGTIEEVDTLFILRTHVLGKQGDYLIPIRVLAEEQALSSTPLPNPYYDGELHPYTHALLDEEEIARLVSHSSLTEALVEKRRAYYHLMHSKQHLLGQLHVLCQQLAFNGAHTGIGRNEEAGSGAYGAIINFFSYYHALGEEKKALIPPPLKSEIEALYILTTSPAENTQGTATFQTCVALRQERLKEVMLPFEAQLANISMSDDDHARSIELAANEWQTQQTRLAQALSTNDYTYGGDKLGISQRLLTFLGERFLPFCLEDVYLLKNFSSDEISSVCQPTDVKKRIINCFSLETFVLFVNGLSRDKLAAFIEALAIILIPSTFIHSVRTLSALLNALDDKRYMVMCAAIGSFLPKIITNGYDLQCLLITLPYSKRKRLVSSINPAALIAILEQAGDVKDFLSCFYSKERLVIYQSLKEHIAELITSYYDLWVITDYLDEQLANELYSQTHKKLTLNLADFTRYYVLLSPADKRLFYEDKKYYLWQLVSSVLDFNNLIICLNDAVLHQELINAKKEQFPHWIHSLTEYKGIVVHLNEEDSQSLYQQMKSELVTLTQSLHDLTILCNHLLPQQFNHHLRCIGERLATMFNDSAAIIDALLLLDTKKYPKMCSIIKRYRPELTTSLPFIFTAIEVLPRKKRLVFYHNMVDDMVPEELLSIAIGHFEQLYIAFSSVESSHIHFMAHEKYYVNFFKAAYDKQFIEPSFVELIKATNGNYVPRRFFDTKISSDSRLVLNIMAKITNHHFLKNLNTALRLGLENTQLHNKKIMYQALMAYVNQFIIGESYLPNSVKSEALNHFR